MSYARHVRNQSGQASIMIGMMMMTFILFFAFVVNTGMLVNAKINLQNAADLAAYAGASVQARQLNQISYLNYEMRRQYKKFLFRYYVIGNMAQAKFPRNGGSGAGKTPYMWSPDGSVNYGVPAVCIIFNANDNFCQLSKLPKIEIPPPNYLDQVNSTLIDQLTKIEQIRQGNCKTTGFTNTTVLRLWLWNTDPNLDNLQSMIPPGSSLQKSINTIRGLAYGIGLVPRELILRQRINTLNEYVNEPAKKNLTLDAIEGMKNGLDPAAQERTIEAFLSAYYTLGNHTFSGGDVVMDELTPSSLLLLKDIKGQFDAYAVDFDITGGTGRTAGLNAQDCSPVVEADSIQSKFPLGVYKDPGVLTYYAIKLKAKAKVMFSPFGDLELKAYAAAQPFGSRIGPMLEETDFVRTGVTLGIPLPPQQTGFKFIKQIPNLPIREADSTGAGSGWDTREALAAYYQKFRSPKTIDQAALERAYQAAMVPNPYEASFYNLINDIGADPFVRNFDSQQIAAFWAPIFSPAKASEANSRIQALVEDLIGDTGPDPAEFKRAIQQQLSNYFDKLRQGNGENLGGVGEGFNIARLQDPFHTRDGGPPQLITLDGDLALTDPERIKTSWNSVLNGAFRKEGRVGYSVKLVSFDSLMGSKQKSDGRNIWRNDLDADAEAQVDLPSIRH